MRLPSLLGTVVLFAACADRAAIDLAQNRAPVFGGVEDDNDAIVAVVIGPLDAPKNLCSGVAVSSRIVVTAAHCVAGETMTDVHVLVGPRLKLPTQTVDVAMIAPYPEYRAPGEDQRAGFDLAVIRTTTELRVTPIALASGPDDLVLGGSVDVVGFGRTTRLDPASIGVRSRARVPVTAVCDRLFASGDESHGFCEGDSGGAVLSPATGALVGLIGFGVRPACAPPGWSTRVAPYAKWIASFIDGPGDSSCATCPSPSVCAPLQADAGARADAAEVDGALDALPPSPHDNGCSTVPRAGGLGGELSVVAAIVAWSRRRFARSRY